MIIRKRVMIIGQPGSGKSTLARAMGSVLDLPVVHLDQIHWQAGWIERSGPEKDRLCRQVHARDTWVFEGGRSTTWSERLARADTLVWLDFPLLTRVGRVVKRTLLYHGKTRPDLPDGCPEHFNIEFIQWIWNTRNTGRARMRALFDSAQSNVDKHRLINQYQIDGFITELTREVASR